MVGYHKNDTMTSQEKLIAGCLAGVMTKCITQPMDVIKLRSQLLRKPKHDHVTYRVARRILSEEGIGAFWHGHVLGQVHSVLAVSSQFFVYELTTKWSSKLNVPKKFRPIENFLCGTVAGCICTTLVIPLEVIRVRQMVVKDQYKSVFKGAQAVYRYGGLKAFYEGLSASLLQMGPQTGISFAVFSFVQPIIIRLLPPCPPEACNAARNKHKAQNILLASSVAGSTAGFVSKSLTYPFDLVKRRLQFSTHRPSHKYRTPSQAENMIKCDRLFQCLYLAYKKEGFKGLFRGWTVTVYKAQITSVFAFTFYEMICFAFREFKTVKTK